jgi:acetyl-CoA carboxylase biotin carboxyl carrier protein
MDHEKLNRLLQMLEGTSVRELEFADGDWKIRLSRGTHSSHAPSALALSDTTVSSHEQPAPSARESAAPRHVVTAGLTGTFFRAPAPDQPPFVSVGDTVQEGQTIGVVEAMKLLNTIEADRAGRIVDIFPDDGALVSPDSELFAIEPLEVAHV